MTETTARRPRVVVLSFDHRPPQEVRSYVDDLVGVGVQVDLLLAETRGTEGLDVDPRVTVRTVLDVAERGRGFVSRVFLDRPSRPAFRVARPWFLTWRARGMVAALDLAGADRIVAGDTSAVPMAWRLARRYPTVRVTTALDRKPYLER